MTWPVPVPPVLAAGPPSSVRAGRHRGGVAGRRWARATAGLLAATALALGPAAPSPAAPSPAAAAPSAPLASASLASAPRAGAPRASAPSLCPGANVALFGPNVCIFSPHMPERTVQAQLNAIADQQVPDQFGPQRYAVLFEPGTYGTPIAPLVFQVGYYTEVAGLGATPQSTVINGVADVFNQCFGARAATGGGTGCVGSDNFWRSLYNLTINVGTGKGRPRLSPPVPDTHDYSTVKGADVYSTSCNDGNEFWATSQAAPIRRVIVNGFLTLYDYCGDENYASGGFISDSELDRGTMNGSQQQFLVRNSTVGTAWTNGVWNQVFMGDNGGAVPAQSFGPRPGPGGGSAPYTTLATTPVSEEEPFLYLGAKGNFEVAVSRLEHGAVGPSWADGGDTRLSISLSKFLVASPATPESAINAALAGRQDLVLTPGVYQLATPLVVRRPGTIVIGLGFATLVPQAGQPAMVAVPNSGVRLSGLIFDAGPVNSPVLLQLGSRVAAPASATNPDLVQDTFFRVGGASAGSASVSFIDDADNSVIDDVWAWRADHGASAADTGWSVNRGATGLVVNGDNVSAYGLFVEHYQKDEVIWDGQGGTDVFFQNEMPYDPPDQADWRQSAGTDGYPAFLVGAQVTTFHGYGMGSYCFFDVPDTAGQADPPVRAAYAFEAPDVPGVQWADLLTVSINGTGIIQNVINSAGGPTLIGTPSRPVTAPVDLVHYP